MRGGEDDPFLVDCGNCVREKIAENAGSEMQWRRRRNEIQNQHFLQFMNGIFRAGDSS